MVMTKANAWPQTKLEIVERQELLRLLADGEMIRMQVPSTAASEWSFILLASLTATLRDPRKATAKQR